MSTELDRPEAQRHIQAELGEALRALGLDVSSTPDARPTPADALPRGSAIGRFMVLERIGRGGQGDVYAVYDPSLDRRVALKRIRGDLAAVDAVHRARLMREAQALARLEHPNVLRVHEAGTQDDAPYLVMEYKTSQTLTRWLAAERRTWREILARFMAAGRGLHAAHKAEIIHRDVKADNIFVDDEVGAVLGDFGFAFGLHEPDDGADTADLPPADPRSVLRQPLTASGQFPGTVGYIAPEALSGRATQRSDQYSFCVAVFHALFHVLAQPDEQRTPQRPGDNPPPALTRALHRGLRRDPAARHRDIEALLAALDVRPRHPAVIPAVAFALLGVLALVAWTFRTDPCHTAAQAKSAAIWNAGRRAAIADAFSAVALPYAIPTGQSFLRRADEYQSRWTAARTATCDAPSPAVEVCLDRQLDRFDRLLTDYATPDPTRAAHALDAVAHLDPPAHCRDPATAARTATPDDLRRTLDQVELRIAEGDFAAAAATVEQTPTDHQNHPRMLWLRGWLAGETTPDRRSDRLLEKSMHEAARALDHDTFVRAATYRLKSLVHDLGEPAEAAALAPWIETTAAQWDPGTTFDRWFRAEFAEARGFLLVATGEHLAAAAQHGHALRLREEDDGPDHPRVAKSHHNLAVSLAYAGDAYDEAHAHYVAALQIRHEQLGEAHPDTLETAFGMAQAECEFFEPDAEYDPAALTDCLSDLAANLDDYRRDPTLDRRGLHRRAVTIAYHALDAGCIPCVEDALATARLALAGLDDVDLHERTDLLAVQAKLHLARDDHPAALAAFSEGVALWEAAGRLEAPYFEHLDGAVIVAVEMQHEDAAATLLLDRSSTMVDASCPTHQRYAASLDALVEFLGPARRVADLRSAAAAARRSCPKTNPP